MSDCGVLPGHDLHRYVEDLCHLEDGIDVPACGCSHVVGGACLGPAVDEFPCAAGKACTHVGVAEAKDLAFLVHALRCDEFEVAVAVLGDGQIGHRAGVGIELGQVAAASLAVEYGYERSSWWAFYRRYRRRRIRNGR